MYNASLGTGLDKTKTCDKYNVSSSKAYWHSFIHWKSFHFFRNWKKGWHLSTDREMNQLKATIIPISHWTNTCGHQCLGEWLDTPKLSWANPKCTLRSIQFQTMLSHCLKGFREIREMIFYSLTLYHPIIYISLHIPSQLFFEHLGHHSLISGSRIFQTKWHNFVMKISSRCNERSFLLVFEGQSYFMVPLKCIKKTHSRVPKSCINKLVYLGHKKKTLWTCLVQICEVHAH